MPSPPSRERGEATQALRPLAAILVGACILMTRADPDLWGHVRFGLDMLASGTLPTEDFYSFTADRAWMNHEWLSEAMMAAAYKGAGGQGLWALKAVLVAMAMLLLHASLHGVSDVYRRGGVALAAASLIPLTATLRPQLWTVVLIVVTARLVQAGGWAVWFLPLVFVVWANAHGGWILGVGLAAAWLGGAVWATRLAWRTAVLILAACAVATLVTPYGLQMWRFIADTVRLGRTDISEWQPLWRSRPDAAICWGAAVTTYAWAWRRWGERVLPALPASLMLAVAAIWVNRLVPLFVLTVIASLAPCVPRDATRRPPHLARAAIDACGVLLGLALLVQWRDLGCVRIPSNQEGPQRSTIASLVAAAPHGRMVTFFDWGQVVIFHLGPSLQVSIDGRRETVYSPEALATQYAIASGTPEGLHELQGLRPDYVWLPLPLGSRTLAWLVANGYRIDIQDESEFVAADVARRPIADTGAPSTPACFPGP